LICLFLTVDLNNNVLKIEGNADFRFTVRRYESQSFRFPHPPGESVIQNRYKAADG
jgi:hypothetical protein